MIKSVHSNGIKIMNVSQFDPVTYKQSQKENANL